MHYYPPEDATREQDDFMECLVEIKRLQAQLDAQKPLVDAAIEWGMRCDATVGWAVDPKGREPSHTERFEAAERLRALARAAAEAAEEE